MRSRLPSLVLMLHFKSWSKSTHKKQVNKGSFIILAGSIRLSLIACHNIVEHIKIFVCLLVTKKLSLYQYLLRYKVSALGPNFMWTNFLWPALTTRCINRWQSSRIFLWKLWNAQCLTAQSIYLQSVCWPSISYRCCQEQDRNPDWSHGSTWWDVVKSRQHLVRRGQVCQAHSLTWPFSWWSVCKDDC